mgnify:CR=1 FL=1
MKKYLFIVLFIGVCFGQVASDTLVMKSGTMHLGKFYGQDDTHIDFKFEKTTEISKVKNSEVQDILLNKKDFKEIKGVDRPPSEYKSRSIGDYCWLIIEIIFAIINVPFII